MNDEYYIDVIGFEGKYQISNMGNIKNCNTGKVLQIFFDRPMNGYARVSLVTEPGKFKNYRVHRLVANHFIPNPENKKTVNHIDGDKRNNAVDNLEWASNYENNRHYQDVLKKSDKYMNELRDLNKSCGYKKTVHGQDLL